MRREIFRRERFAPTGKIGRAPTTTAFQGSDTFTATMSAAAKSRIAIAASNPSAATFTGPSLSSSSSCTRG